MQYCHVSYHRRPPSPLLLMHLKFNLDLTCIKISNFDVPPYYESMTPHMHLNWLLEFMKGTSPLAMAEI